jgi:hypothetical protein
VALVFFFVKQGEMEEKSTQWTSLRHQSPDFLLLVYTGGKYQSFQRASQPINYRDLIHAIKKIISLSNSEFDIQLQFSDLHLHFL